MRKHSQTWLFALMLVAAQLLTADASGAESEAKEKKTGDTLAVLNFGGGSGSIGGLQYSSGFTVIDVAGPTAVPSRIIVSMAHGSRDTQQSIRVVAEDKSGKRHTADSFSSSSGTGREFGVTTVVSEFDIASSEIRKLVITRRSPSDDKERD